MNSLDIHPQKTSRGRKKRLGRGIGSTLGKTCGKGHKGQKSRSGASIPLWFEGGQTPLYRRVPKRGFFNKFAQEWSIINVGDLATSIKKVSTALEINPEILRQNGVVNKKDHPLKLLGRAAKENLSTLKGKKIILNACSQKAREMVEKAGGSIEIVKYDPYHDKKKNKDKKEITKSVSEKS